MTNNQTEFVRNILAVYDRSTAYEVDAGSAWYGDNQAILAAIARKYDIPVWVVCAVAAVLSPRVKWESCLRDTLAVVEGWARGDYGVKTSGYGLNREKAYRILDESSDTHCRGSKVSRFYENLTGDTQPVTVDVWAARAAHNSPDYNPGSINERQYAQYEAAYKLAADIAGLPPSQLQAITWLTIRRLSRHPWSWNQLALF